MAIRGRKGSAANYLRASISNGRGRRTLDELRQSGSIHSVRNLVPVAYRVPNGGRFPILAGLTRDYRSLLSFKAYSPITFAAELEWATWQLDRWSGTLAKFVQLRKQIQLAAICGKWDLASDGLNLVAGLCGVSAWLIAAKTAILQWAEGQDAQKEFARDIITSATGLPVGIAHLCSQRNEDAVTVSGYLARADNVIRDWNLSPEWEAYLRSVALKTPPKNLEQVANLLRVASTGSILDLYEATTLGLLSISTLAEPLDAPSEAGVIRCLERLAPIHDPLVSELSRAFGRGLQGVSAPDELVPSFGAMLTQARSSNIHGQETSDFLPKLHSALSSVSNRLADAKSSSRELDKFALAFDFLPVGRALALYGNAVTSRGAFPYEAVRSSLASFLGGFDKGIWGEECGTRQGLLQNLERSVAEGDRSAAIESCIALEKGDAFECVAASKARFELAQVDANWWQAIEIATSCLVRFPGAAHEFPLAELLAGLSWAELKQRAERLELGLCLAYAIKEASNEAVRQKLHRHLQQTAIRILRAHGCQLFSDLARISDQNEIMKAFLSEGCVESVMEANTRIRSSRALAEERMKVCQELSLVDEGKAAKYLEEIKQITFGLELEEGVRHFDSSRLFVNTEGLSKWALGALAEDYSRYLSLRVAALPDVAEIQAALVTIQMAEKGAGIPAVLLEQPRTEADRLLTEIVQRLSREFYTNAVFGLNAFLSLRIRHGSLAGHLRGPLEEFGVIASRRDGGGYVPIERWAGIRADIGERSEEFDLIFERLSSRVDELIRKIVDDRLQVRSESKPDGIFEDSVSVILINALRGSLSDASTLPEMLEICITNFKVGLEPTLEKIRREIGESLKSELDQSINEAVVELERLVSTHELAAVLDALGRARTNLAFAVDRVAQWFRPLDRVGSDKSYSMEQIIRMGERLTINARPTFQPVLHYEIGDQIPQLGAQSGAFLIADALFIVFDNVYLHSGLDNPIDIFVRVSITKEGFISFQIENRVSITSLSERRAKLDKIRAQLESGEFRKRVAGEGGTGFFKLRRLGEASAFEGRSNIEFELQDDRFVVDLLVPLLIREVQAEEPNETLAR